MGQSERRNAVDNSEIGRFGPAPLFARHILFGRMEQQGRRRGMDILAVPERFDHRPVAAQVRHQPQFDLRIVG